MKLAILDFETTGLDPETCGIIDAAIMLIDTDTWGHVASYESLNDPGMEISAEITEITGIRPQDVAEHTLDAERFLEIAYASDLLVAHNAPFDRGFFERRIAPEPMHWACSLTQIDWYGEHRMPCRHLRHIAFELGLIPGIGHRAMSDVETLVEILLAKNPRSGRRFGEDLIEAASASWVLVEATSAPFAAREVLKGAGWRWAAARKVWWRTVRADGLDALGEWLGEKVYPGTPCHRATLHVDPLSPNFEKAHDLS